MSRRSELLVFGAPSIGEAEIAEVVDSLRVGWIGTGPKAARFERAFRELKGGVDCAAVGSCTAALHLSILCLDLEPGDEVITSAMTFCATVNAILHAGATPVLADIDPVSMNIDPASVERAITDRTRAIMPVHFAGRPCDMDPLLELGRKHDLRVIEDCAHAIETTDAKGRHAGTIGDFGCFSFYATKNVTTAEGGMVIASRREDVDRVKRLSLHGLSADAWSRYSDAGYKHYFVNELGFKCNMTDLQAGLGIHQLARVEASWARRQEIWDQYQLALKGLPIGLPAQPEPGTRHAYHLYTVLIDSDQCGIDRDRFLVAMHEENIGLGVHYLSVAEHPFYQRFGWRPEQWPEAMRIGRQTISLPLSPALTDQDVEDVIGATRRVLGRA